MKIRYDPVPWLLVQEGLPSVRARRRLGLDCDGDAAFVRALVADLEGEQKGNGSFAGSPMRTAGTLILLADLRAQGAEDLRAQGIEDVVERGAAYLFSVLAGQPGYGREDDISPGSLTTPCDLGGFFGPYEERNDPQVRAFGAREMNHYREFEPLLGPKSPVRETPRSSRDRAGPSSCYAWGLIPLSYIFEALCRAGYAEDERLQPALRVLLGVQRESGGWCRNLGGHIGCSPHPMRALGAHPALRSSLYAERALRFLLANWRARDPYAVLHVATAYDLPAAHELVREVLAYISPRQRKNGTFGAPHRIERVAAVLDGHALLA